MLGDMLQQTEMLPAFNWHCQ